MSVAQRVRISSIVLLRRRDWAGGAGPVVDAWKGVMPTAGAVVVVDGWALEVVVPKGAKGVMPGAVEVAAG